MMQHQHLDLGRPDFEAGRVDHAFHAVNHEEIAVCVAIPDVTGAEERHAVDLHKSLGGGLRALPVAGEVLRGVHDNFTHFAVGQFGVASNLQHTAVDFINWLTKALALGGIDGIDVGSSHGFRQAIALDVVQTGHVFEPFGNGVWHGRAAAADHLQGREVIAVKIRVVHQINRHGRNRAPAGDFIALDQTCGQFGGPARQDHIAPAGQDRCAHAADHAGDVEKR
mmetsp:Transcript_14755/g.23339  ORF Transcript_14755/g.23339 Transcript_14755/m.23339 type:complete len:224 (+) Transcript_14755:330-1001(+)